MRGENGVNRNRGDEGFFSEELWKNAEAVVSCCQLGTDYDVKANRRHTPEYEAAHGFYGLGGPTVIGPTGAGGGGGAATKPRSASLAFSAASSSFF